MKLWPPLRFRFHEDDRERYGDDWYVYDEAALLRIPAPELVEIEQTVGMSVPTMLMRARQNFTDANLAATWVARRLAGVKEPFAKYQPLVLLIDWEKVPRPKPAGKAAGDDANPPERTSSTSPSGE